MAILNSYRYRGIIKDVSYRVVDQLISFASSIKFQIYHPMGVSLGKEGFGAKWSDFCAWVVPERKKIKVWDLKDKNLVVVGFNLDEVVHLKLDKYYLRDVDSFIYRNCFYAAGGPDELSSNLERELGESSYYIYLEDIRSRRFKLKDDFAKTDVYKKIKTALMDKCALFMSKPIEGVYGFRGDVFPELSRIVGPQAFPFLWFDFDKFEIKVFKTSEPKSVRAGGSIAKIDFGNVRESIRYLLNSVNPPTDSVHAIGDFPAWTGAYSRAY